MTAAPEFSASAGSDAAPQPPSDEAKSARAATAITKNIVGYSDSESDSDSDNADNVSKQVLAKFKEEIEFKKAADRQEAAGEAVVNEKRNVKDSVEVKDEDKAKVDESEDKANDNEGIMVGVTTADKMDTSSEGVEPEAPTTADADLKTTAEKVHREAAFSKASSTFTARSMFVSISTAVSATPPMPTALAAFAATTTKAPSPATSAGVAGGVALWTATTAKASPPSTLSACAGSWDPSTPTTLSPPKTLNDSNGAPMVSKDTTGSSPATLNDSCEASSTPNVTKASSPATLTDFDGAPTASQVGKASSLATSTSVAGGMPPKPTRRVTALEACC
jgi:hypothetical protein